jgi:hypothetical protein
MHCQDTFFDKRFRPDLREQFPLLDQATRAAQQRDQDIVCLRR